MKILLLTPYFSPHTGGIENVALHQAEGLIKKGYKVTIITSKLKHDRQTEYSNGITIRRISVYNFFEEKLGIPCSLFSLKLLKVVNEEVKTNDIIHAHGHVYLPSIIAAYFSTKYKKPFILTQHNIYILYKNFIFRFLQNIADNTIGKFTLSRANHIIAVSKKSKEYVLSLIKNKNNISVLYNGVEINRFQPSESAILLKNKLHLNRDIICLTVRRITFKNGIDMLLQVAKELKNDKHITILIGGKGPDFAKVQKYVEENSLKNVKLLGYISDQELPQYYAAADMFLLPSKTGEGFPLAVLEAFASGIPVIATRSGGHVEIIQKDETGCIVETNDYKGMAKEVVALANNRPLLKKMSNKCREVAVERFSWEENLKQLITIYEGSYENKK